jgi:hypothetical protein
MHRDVVRKGGSLLSEKLCSEVCNTCSRLVKYLVSEVADKQKESLRVAAKDNKIPIPMSFDLIR